MSMMPGVTNLPAAVDPRVAGRDRQVRRRRRRRPCRRRTAPCRCRSARPRRRTRSRRPARSARRDRRGRSTGRGSCRPTAGARGVVVAACRWSRRRPAPARQGRARRSPEFILAPITMGRAALRPRLEYRCQLRRGRMDAGFLRARLAACDSAFEIVARIAVLERVEVHPALHDRAEQQHDDRRADRDPAEQLVDVEQALLAHLAVVAAGRLADLAGDEVADRGHVEPRAHDQRLAR